jgi:hypothetical protein
LQEAHHYKTWNQKGGIAKVTIHLHLAFQYVAKNQQVQYRGQYRRCHRLKRNFIKPLYFFAKQGRKATAIVKLGILHAAFPDMI